MWNIKKKRGKERLEAAQEELKKSENTEKTDRVIERERVIKRRNSFGPMIQDVFGAKR